MLSQEFDLSSNITKHYSPFNIDHDIHYLISLFSKFTYFSRLVSSLFVCFFFCKHSPSFEQKKNMFYNVPNHLIHLFPKVWTLE